VKLGNMAKKTDITKKSTADLVKDITEKREGLRKIRFSTAGAGAKDVMKVRNTRKEIARLLTELNVRKSALNTAVK